MTETFAGTIFKTPGDRVWLVFDFGNLPELLAGATIAALSVPQPVGLTVTGVVLVGTYKVGAWYSSGVDGTDYTVTCTITLSDGTIIARTGTLKVRAT